MSKVNQDHRPKFKNALTNSIFSQQFVKMQSDISCCCIKESHWHILHQM